MTTVIPEPGNLPWALEATIERGLWSYVGMASVVGLSAFRGPA